MEKKAISLWAIIIFFSAGCTKEINSEGIQLTSGADAAVQTNGTIDTTGTWFGAFKTCSCDPDQLPDTLPESQIIKNGEATPSYENEDDITNVGYYLPAEKTMQGDSIEFEAAIKDDRNIAEMDIIGSENVASIAYTKSKNNFGTVTMIVGNTKQTVQTNIIDFTSFKTVKIVLKANHAFLHISSQLVLSFGYPKRDRIGLVKMLSMGDNYNNKLSLPDNGNIACDFVRLYNSYSKKLLMREEFNIDGKSNTIFY